VRYRRTLIGAALLLAPTSLPAVATAAATTTPAQRLFTLTLANHAGWELSITGEQGATQIGVGLLRFRRTHGASVQYFAPGTITKKRIAVDLGSNGKLDVTFKPGRTTTRTVPKPCKAARKARYTSGHWVGTIRFDGDLGFTTVHAGHAAGTLQDLPKTTCSTSSQAARATSTVFLSSSAPEGSTQRFSASRSRGENRFEASIKEQRGAIEIVRDVYVKAGAFSFSPELSSATATVSHAPFAGSLAYARTSSTVGTATGDLSVVFPGLAGRVPLAGPGWGGSLSRS
jgi:hypothetical protein